jgi:hypothetical protein
LLDCDVVFLRASQRIFRPAVFETAVLRLSAWSFLRRAWQHSQPSLALSFTWNTIATRGKMPDLFFRIGSRSLPLIVTMTRVIEHHAVLTLKLIGLMVRRRIAGDIHGSRISRRLRRDVIHLLGARWLLTWPGQCLRCTGKHYGRRAIPNRGRAGRRDCLPRPNQWIRGLATCSNSGEQHDCNCAWKFLHCGLSKNPGCGSLRILRLGQSQGPPRLVYPTFLSLRA